MRMNITFALCTACVALGFSAGCSKQEAPPAASPERSTAPAAAAQTPDAPAQAVPAAEAEPLDAAATRELERVQGLIEKAKGLAEQGEYAEALQVLNELSNVTLTPEQQGLVDGVKKSAEQQAAKALQDKAAADASKAVGNVLGGKK